MRAQGENEYEWIFVVSGVADPFDPKIEQVEAQFDCMVDCHTDITLFTLTTPGTSAFTAGVAAVHVLDATGITVDRSYQDLVTRQDIADRAEVTRQAVGNWVRGERAGANRFPAAVSLVAGGLWLWRDVNRWLSDRGLTHDSLGHPTLDDHAHLDSWLLSRARQRSVGAESFRDVGYIAASSRFAARVGGAVPVDGPRFSVKIAR